MNEEFDVIILGTNLVESILAAALARVGKKVLYIESATWYGGKDATLSLTEFSNSLLVEQNDSNNDNNTNTQQDTIHPTSKLISKLSNSKSCFTLFPIGNSLNNNDILSSKKLFEYNIDLSSQLIFSRGLAVSVLAESGVSRYLEFQPLDGIFYFENDNIKEPLSAPQSKSQVFSSKELSMVEKRQLMRFLQFCSDYHAEDTATWTNERLGASNPGRSLSRPQNKNQDENLLEKAKNNENESFSLFLERDIRMSKRLCEVVRYVLARESCKEKSISTREGMKNVGAYISAMGRFGSTPFISSMYGTGEICQGFSRLCAVYGGTCALATQPLAIFENGFVSIRNSLVEHGIPPFVKANLAVIVNGSYIGETDALFQGISKELEVHCICIVNKSLFGDKNSNRVAFFLTPQQEEEFPVNGVQLDSKCKVVPEGLYLIHMTTFSNKINLEKVSSRLEHFLDNIISKRGGEQLYRQQYARYRSFDASISSQNLHIIGDCLKEKEHILEIELNQAFFRAEKIFKIICPNEQFLPASDTELRAREEEIAAMDAMPDL